MSLDPASYPALWSITAQTGIRPEWLLPVLFAESGFNPSVVNSIGCAGINQLCKGWLDKLGFTAQGYASLPASEQIKQGVLPYMAAQIASYGPLRSGVRVYQANYLPATLSEASARAAGVGYGKHLTDVLTQYPNPYYTQNIGFDTARKGYITLQDVADAVARAAANPTVKEAIANAYAVPVGAIAAPNPHGPMEDPVYGEDFGFYEKNRPWLIAAAIFASSAAIAYGLTIDYPPKRRRR